MRLGVVEDDLLLKEFPVIRGAPYIRLTSPQVIAQAGCHPAMVRKQSFSNKIYKHK
jgi:hypothetical protein